MDSVECMAALEDTLTRAGTSKFWYCIKKLKARRLEVRGRTPRKRYSWYEYKYLYEQQDGRCGICQEVIPLIRGKIEMDHKNCNLTGDAYEDRSNRQVTCQPCNREKGALSIAQQSKKYSKTMAELV